jgi:galactokinase/mevalonate kinase-like predicted kinase
VCELSLENDGLQLEDDLLWRAARARFPLPKSASVIWETAIPRSSGLSGSTALLSATLACAMWAAGSPRPFEASYAELLRDVERNDAGIVCGYQDAYMITFGGLQLMNFAGKHPVEGGPPATLQSLSAPLPFLLVTTGVERVSGSVHRPMVERWLAGEMLVVDSVKVIGELALPGAEALVEGRYEELGRLMDENQRLTAGIGGSGEAVDLLVARCKGHRALGAKLAGAGHGGTVIALSEDLDTLERDLRRDGYTQFMRPSIEPGTRMENQPN